MLSQTRLIIFLCLILAVLISASALLIATQPARPVITQSGTVTAPGLTGDFTLIDENGATVTPATFAGQYKLIFFGFTHCPSICPTELLKIADIMAALPKDMAAQITPLFITVDPARDTAAKLKKYTDNFDPRIVGLTGTDAQIRAAIDAFKVYAARVDSPAAPGVKKADYMFDHSTFLYLFGPGHDLIKLYRMSETANDINGDLKKTIR